MNLAPPWRASVSHANQPRSLHPDQSGFSLLWCCSKLALRVFAASRLLARVAPAPAPLLRHRRGRFTSMQVLNSQENVPAVPAQKMQRVEAPTIPLRVHLMNEHAMLPKRGSEGAAGYDLYR